MLGGTIMKSYIKKLYSIIMVGIMTLALFGCSFPFFSQKETYKFRNYVEEI